MAVHLLDQNVLIGVIAAVLALKTLKLHEKLVDRLRLDYVGGILWMTAIISLMLTMGEIATAAGINVLALFFMAVFAASLAGFTVWKKERRNPFWTSRCSG